jgi:hypothetical protein
MNHERIITEPKSRRIWIQKPLFKSTKKIFKRIYEYKSNSAGLKRDFSHE